MLVCCCAACRQQTRASRRNRRAGSERAPAAAFHSLSRVVLSSPPSRAAAGRRTVYEIMTARQSFDEIAGLAGKTPVQTLSRKELDKIARTEFHQGIIAKVSPYRYATLQEVADKGVAVLLDSVEDPQNTGSIIRTAFALADAGIVIPEDRSAQITPAVAITFSAFLVKSSGSPGPTPTA